MREFAPVLMTPAPPPQRVRMPIVPVGPSGTLGSMPKGSFLGVLALAALVSVGGCKDNNGQQTNPPDQTANAGNTGQPDQPTTSGQAGQPTQQQPPQADANGVVPGSKDDPRYHSPEVSKDPGQAGGVVVLWPRIIPSAIADQNAATASSIQQHMQQIAGRALPGRPINVRPNPERVCPKGGCAAPSLNVFFTRQANACVAVALVAGAGEVNTRLVPWAGEVVFKGGDSVPFRQPPENQVTIKDYVPCDALMTEMAKQDAAVEAALRAVGG